MFAQCFRNEQNQVILWHWSWRLQISYGFLHQCCLEAPTSGFSPRTFARVFTFPTRCFSVHLNHRVKGHITTPELSPAGSLMCLCAHGWWGRLKTARCLLDLCYSSSSSRGAEYVPPSSLQSHFSPELQEFPALTVWTQMCFCKCVLFVFTEME